MNQDYYDEGRAERGWNALPDALSRMGYTELRGTQKPCIKTIFGGQDVFCVLATGGGKTALAALPTLCFNCQTIIFSPLIALMKDQVDSLNRKGIRAGAINSNQSDTENWQTLNAWAEGKCQIMYVAPERIKHPQFSHIMRQSPPSIVVIDEAHMMSKDSRNFRPSYVNCGDFVREYAPDQVIMLTATATQEIIDDVVRIMGTENYVLERHYEERRNLHLSSSVLPNDKDLLPAIRQACNAVKGSVIVYCSTVKQVASVMSYLAQVGESVTYYHGQISSQTEKDMNQDSFMQNRARIMVATNAFGMGIDKPDIEAIIHASPPGSVEAIAQETGRAARDGRDAYCHMFSTPSGIFMQKFLWESSNPRLSTVQKTMQFIKTHVDKDQMLQMTGEAIGEQINDSSAPAALNYLVSLGCIERLTPTNKVATIIVQPGDHGLVKNRKKVLDMVMVYGFKSGTSGTGGTVYQIDLGLLTDKVALSQDTVVKHLVQMHKDGVIHYTAPYTGKLTRFLKDLTPEDLRLVEERRNSEWQKVIDVREYMAWPDHLKHEFLSDYFALDI